MPFSQANTTLSPSEKLHSSFFLCKKCFIVDFLIRKTGYIMESSHVYGQIIRTESLIYSSLYFLSILSFLQCWWWTIRNNTYLRWNLLILKKVNKYQNPQKNKSINLDTIWCVSLDKGEVKNCKIKYYHHSKFILPSIKVHKFKVESENMIILNIFFLTSEYL